MKERLLHLIRQLFKLLPAPFGRKVLSAYHLSLALLGALVYRFPSRKLIVIGVTGTKGKTSVSEMLHAVLEEAGAMTVLSNTIRFKAGGHSTRNLRKMTMPGRFFVQRLLREGVKNGATHAIIEMTSEGAKQHRHRFIDLDALIFTNLAPEHIESHGSIEAYGNAKLSIGHALEASPKRPRIVVANGDDPWGQKFLALKAEKKIPFTLKDAMQYGPAKEGYFLTVRGRQYKTPLPGEANVKNLLAVILLALEMGIDEKVVERAIAKLSVIPGRFEDVNEGGTFPVIVDYAHTPESLEELYKTFEGKRRICVLGSTGGGRDIWKRPAMGALAEKYCDTIILTNEDPYDEDPMQIINDVASGMKSKKPQVIADRKNAISEAVRHAGAGDAVLISGKGTDPYIMGAKGSKIPWSDAEVARSVL